MSIETVFGLLPELNLIVTATLIYVIGAFYSTWRWWGWVAVTGALASGGMLFAQHPEFFGQAIARSPISMVRALGAVTADLYLRWLIWLAGLLFVLVAGRAGPRKQQPEYVGTLLLAVAGLMLVASARDLVSLFVGLELISIPTYVLLYLGRANASSQEACAKYFFLSILASALLLYGFSFLYGIAGSTELSALRAALAEEASSATNLLLLARVAIVLVFAGLAFKIGAVPFHFYAPDVYQGTTNANSGVLAVLPKIAGMVALVKVVFVAMPGLELVGWRLSLILAIMTMTLGNVLALWQDHVRRLLAYSSVAHAGYLLVGLGAAFGAAEQGLAQSAIDGISAVFFYLALYALATAGAFAALAWLGSEDRDIDGVDELAGLGRTHPVAAACLAICMFSLAGIPPLAGFWGKLQIFGSALGLAPTNPARAWFILLAIIGVVNAAVAAAYYLRIVNVMYFRGSINTPRAQGGEGARLAMVLSAALVVGIGVYSRPLITASSAAAQAIRLPSRSDLVHVDGMQTKSVGNRDNPLARR